MTKEEAISVLYSDMDNKSCDGCQILCRDLKCPVNEALDMAIKALEQEPCEDEYIKVPKKALKYRTAGMVAYNVEWLKNHFDIEQAVICGTQEPSGDMVSRGVFEQVMWERDVAIEQLKELGYGLGEKPKTGHWDSRTCKCSECGYQIAFSEYAERKYKYCPNCGARMFEHRKGANE